jgi:broad specificity phosphatase PhoE
VPLKIVLVRHGRSAHVHSGWIDGAEFLRWREAYEAAGIDSDGIPPPELGAAAAACGVLVASVARRAVESANMLAPGREVLTSPLLCELALPPPALGPIRLPLFGWALTIGLRWLARAALGRPRVTEDEARRAREAAEWLSQLAESHGSVVAVTHGSFRSLLAQELIRTGWQGGVPRRKAHHWSTWSFTRSQCSPQDTSGVSSRIAN